jgi:hypothetical protein
VSWRGLQACVMATEEQRAQKVKGRELGLTRQLRRALRSLSVTVGNVATLAGKQCSPQYANILHSLQ